jgi:5'-3' exonuclease
MRIHLVDGTYELFRHHFALPLHQLPGGQHVGAVRGVVGSMLSLLEEGATHVGVATDHVIESFRNELYAGYKTGAGVPEELMSQFPVLEDVLRAAGFVVMAMVEHEADDALAAAAAIAAADPRVEQVLICTPDKDLAQCVREDGKVIQIDRSRRKRIDHAAVVEKYGVPARAIPDWLALVGDTADGYPGLPGFGAKSAAALLVRFGRIEDVPDRAAAWGGVVRGADRLAATLQERRDEALLYRRLATLVTDVPGMPGVDALRWRGPLPGFADVAAALEQPALATRAAALAARLT